MKPKNILYVDTSSNKEIIISLQQTDREDIHKTASDFQRAQVVLPMIEEVLKRNKVTLHDLTGIEVHLGPGSFTGLRVGVTIANTLGIVLGIPVSGRKVGELVEPVYT